MYISCAKHLVSGTLQYSAGSSAPFSVMTGRGGMEVLEGWDVYIHIADSLPYIVDI